MTSPAGLREKQAAQIARYLIIEDPQERLAAIVARGRKWPAPAEEERTEWHLVKGCMSRVYLAGRLEEGRCRYRMSADSPLVQGLAALLCELYDDAPPAEIVEVEPELIEELGFIFQISPTRYHGLENVRRVIREFAAQQLG